MTNSKTVDEDEEKRILMNEKARQLMDKVISVYTKNFADDNEGRGYLEGLGITDAGIWDRYTLGYSNGRLNEILPRKGQIVEDLKQAGILSADGEECFRDYVVVPVRDIEGNIETVYGYRLSDGRTEFKMISDSVDGLWNIEVIKTYPKVILVPSILDALSVAQSGFPNVVATIEGGPVSDKDLKLLKDYGVREIVAINGENPGERFSEVDIKCRFKRLRENQDINGYLRSEGAEGLAAFIREDPGQESVAQKGDEGSENPNADFTVRYGQREYQVLGLGKSARRLRATVRVQHAGRLHVDTLDFYAARARKALVQDICRIFNQMPETIESDITRLMLACEQHQPTDHKTDISPLSLMSDKEKKEAQAFGKRSDLMEQIVKDFETCGLIGEEPNKLLGYLVMTSRRMEVPLALLIMSSSGAGKTALQDAVCAFCPEEDLRKLTSLSGKALFYKDAQSLKHKVLALEEGDGAEDASYALRNLISAGSLASESTVKDMATGKLTTMENKVEGPTAVFLTTTNPRIDPETKSRFFVTSIDESREQTRRILDFQRKKHLYGGPTNSSEIETILTRHRNFQRLLKKLAVKNPFAAKLTYGDDRLQSRRDQPKYLNLIKTVAFLRQMVKQVQYEDKGGNLVPFIEVEIEDIKITNALAHEVLGKSLDELSRPSRDLLIQLDDMLDDKIKSMKGEVPNRSSITFSRRDIREYTGWSNTRLHIHLRELVDFEYVVVQSGRNGMRFRYRLAYEGQGKGGEKFMLGLTDIKELEG